MICITVHKTIDTLADDKMAITMERTGHLTKGTKHPSPHILFIIEETASILQFFFSKCPYLRAMIIGQRAAYYNNLETSVNAMFL